MGHYKNGNFVRKEIKIRVCSLAAIGKFLQWVLAISEEIGEVLLWVLEIDSCVIIKNGNFLR